MIKILKKKIINIILKTVEKKYASTLATDTKFDLKTFKDLLRKFDIIEKNIQCAHSHFDFYVMYAMLLTLPIDGPVIELGCFKGGSTAKLSQICKLTGRKLYVFDSFKGLPPPRGDDVEHHVVPWISDKKVLLYKEGSYEGTLGEVKKNIANYGCIDVCEFFEGYFENTLPDFQVRPAFIFMDVDYIESARVVLKHLWPKLLSDGFLFSHEAYVVDFIEAITDATWWQKELNQNPPLLYGAGYGTPWKWGHFTMFSGTVYFHKHNNK